jgi:hemerythrin-like domain-containing protein
VEEKITELKKAKEGEDISLIKSATETLSKEIQKIGEQMQKNQNENKNEDQKPPEENK